MDIKIRTLQVDDKSQWYSLWNAYNHFYQSTISAEVTERTWERMLDTTSSVCCRVAVDGNNVVGFAIFVLHEGTWVTTPICYLEDLFVAEHLRGNGIARQLLQHLIDEGKREGWSRLYWHTANDNPARKLYDQFVSADGFVRYRINL